MRTKLTEIISTMDQYNGMRAHRDKYQGGEQIDIQTEMPGAPQHATIQEGMQTPTILEMLHEEDPQTESQPRLCEPNDRILRFEEFVHECYIREVSEDDTDPSETEDEKEEE